MTMAKAGTGSSSKSNPIGRANNLDTIVLSACHPKTYLWLIKQARPANHRITDRHGNQKKHFLRSYCVLKGEAGRLSLLYRWHGGYPAQP